MRIRNNSMVVQMIPWKAVNCQQSFLHSTFQMTGRSCVPLIKKLINENESSASITTLEILFALFNFQYERLFACLYLKEENHRKQKTLNDISVSPPPIETCSPLFLEQGSPFLEGLQLHWLVKKLTIFCQALNHIVTNTNSGILSNFHADWFLLVVMWVP